LIIFLKDFKCLVEIRNKHSLVPQFIDTLREYGVALALIDQSWMPRPAQWFEKFDPITADFTYVRWLGDRTAIEEKTKVWNKLVVDRIAELQEWADVLASLTIPIYVYANNHYAGYRPATVEVFRNLWRGRAPETTTQYRMAEKGSCSNKAQVVEDDCL
jgi:uncharacterized protein YecE (DUF72 family)